MRRLLLICLAAVPALQACGGGGAEPAEPRSAASSPEPSARAPVHPKWPDAHRFEPDSAEAYPNGKRLAARIAAGALTYPRGATARDVAERLGQSVVGTRALAAALEPVVDPRAESVGQVVYPQLSGVTTSSLGAMVVVRQRVTGPRGGQRTLVRVLDIRLRLRRPGGRWRLDRIGSVGGQPVRRPQHLSADAREVLANRNITLTDSARWDIYRGDIDDGLLRALDRLADPRRISISVLRSGHPREIWDTSRPSAHSRGYAADIYAVDGRLVVRQRQFGSPAYGLAAALVNDGATQLGSPWVLGRGGSRSFSDAVHQDHLHLQWSEMP